MRLRIWFINLALAAVVIFFGIRTYQVWFAPEKPIAKPKSARTSSPEIRILPKTVPPRASYTIVAEKTIFSPDRKEQTKKAETVPQTTKAPTKFSLCGIMISGAYKYAFVSDATKPGAKSMRVKEGDSLDELKVSAIQNDRIILTDADSRQEILLYDAAKVVRREQVQKDAEPIIIAGSESQSRLLQTEKQPANPLAAAMTAPAEKKPESLPDKKPAVHQEKPIQPPPAPAKTQGKPVQDDMNNPLFNLLRGMK